MNKKYRKKVIINGKNTRRGSPMLQLYGLDELSAVTFPTPFMCAQHMVYIWGKDIEHKTV